MIRSDPSSSQNVVSSPSIGVNWIQRHAGALLGPLGVIVAIALVFGCCNCGFSGVATTRFGPMSTVYMLPVYWFFGELFGVVNFTFLGAGCIAADQAESAGQPAGGPRPF